MSGPSSFTAKQLQELREAFNKIDEDGSGELDEDEIKGFLRSVGMEEDYAGLIKKIFDTDGNGLVSFDEFKDYINALREHETDSKKLFRMLFKAIDEDNSGTIDANEMVEFCGYLHVDMTKEDAEEAIKEIDADGNGRIDFDELCTALGLE